MASSDSASGSEGTEEFNDKTQADLLAEYDEMFQDRYTDIDPDYILTRDLPLPPPPCVENWYTKPKRTFDWSRNDNRNRGRGNWRGHGRGGYGGQDRGYNDRGYGRGGDGRWNDRGYQGYGHDRHGRGGYRDRNYSDDRHDGGRNYGRERGHGGQGHYRGRPDRVHYAGVRDSAQSYQRQGDRYHPYNR